jgi:hypothetical protein
MPSDKRTHFKQELTKARTDLINLLTLLTDRQLQTPIISEESQSWTVLDIVAHLLENERAMSIHVHKIRHGKETVPAGFDLDKWNEGLKGRLEPRPLPDLLEDLAQTRAKTFEVLESIKDEEWGLRGRHPARGTITIAQYYETIANHDRWHTNDIKQGLG